jgi:glycosyltransferase involved in cell wall biosynthesis
VDVITAQSPGVDGWIAHLFGRIVGSPDVLQLHFDPFGHVATTKRGGRRLVRRGRLLATLALARRAAAVRVVNRETRARLTEAGVTTPVAIIPVPVLLDPPTSSDLDAAPRPPVVLFVGRLVAAKNPSRWVEVAAGVAARCREVEFVVAGDGPLRNAMDQECRALGLDGRVRFLGEVPHARLSEVYEGAAILLLTSDSEGLGRVLIEAGSHGVPAVAPDIAGVRDVVTDGVSGVLVPATKVNCYVNAIVSLVEDPDALATLAEGARSSSRLFDPDRLVSVWIDLLIANASGRLRS